MRFYRVLLALYPARFRAEYRDEMSRAFAERSRGRWWPARIAMALADVVPNAIGAHWDVLRHGTAAGTTWPAFGSDVRFALRQIARAPLLSGVIIAVLALGIGINAGLLTLVDTYVWRPAPGIPADRSLARLMPAAWREGSGRMTDVRLSYPEILDLRAQRDVFADVAAWTAGFLAVDLAGGAERVTARYTTANYFQLLRVPLAAGAGFGDDTDRASGTVAVIDHARWIAEFGGSPDVIGQTIRVMNQPFTIVGVAPPRFSGVDVLSMGQPTIWLPLAARAILEPGTAHDLARRDAAIFSSVARLAPGLSAAEVERRVAPLAARFAQQEPATRERFTLRAERLTGIASNRSDRTELVAALFLVAALIVVITCTNVSALLLGRATARRREVGVRLAMGATRLRLIRQMLTESLVHALAGALLALALYAVTIRVAYAALPEVVYGLQLQPATFLFATAFAVLTAIAFGLAPALHATSADIGEVMKNSGTHGIRRSRLQRTFVVVQLACSQPLLVVTSLVLVDIRDDAKARAEMAPASVVTMSSVLLGPEPAEGAGGNVGGNVGGAGARGAESPTSPRVLEAMGERLRALPGVRVVALSTDGTERAPVVQSTGRVSLEAQPETGAGARAQVRQVYVNADYRAAYGFELLRGRWFTTDDDQPGATAVVVNDAAADLLWPGEDPVGKRMVRRAPDGAGAAITLDVIGVIGAAPYEREEQTPHIFVPLATAPSAWQSTIAVHTTGDARAHVPLIRAAIREVEPYATLDDVRTLAERYASERREAMLANAAAFAVGVATLVLASLGLYAIIAFAVAQRTREIGIRLAMGATKGRVVRDFFRSGLVASAIGLAIGVPATVAGIQVVKASVLGFTPRNVVAVMAVVPVLIVVAALASWLPARRAGSVDPVIALRSE